MNETDATERDVDFPDATQFDAAVDEIIEIAKRLGNIIPAVAMSDWFDCPADDWVRDFRDLGLLTTHAELVGSAYVPDEEMADLLRRGRELVDRLYPSPGITPAEIPSLPAQEGAAQ